MPKYKYVEYARVCVCALVLSPFYILLYVNDTNIIVISVNYNNLQKVNATLQLIPEFIHSFIHSCSCDLQQAPQRVMRY